MMQRRTCILKKAIQHAMLDTCIHIVPLHYDPNSVATIVGMVADFLAMINPSTVGICTIMELLYEGLKDGWPGYPVGTFQWKMLMCKAELVKMQNWIIAGHATPKPPQSGHKPFSGSQDVISKGGVSNSSRPNNVTTRGIKIVLCMGTWYTDFARSLVMKLDGLHHMKVIHQAEMRRMEREVAALVWVMQQQKV
eukprot:Gb_18300 [translate_table: standard]